jgi:hypothetical protein
MRTPRLAAVLGALLAVTVLIGGTGLGNADAPEPLPPASRKDLVAIFAKKVKPFGLRVTRAALVNPRQERDPEGTHLAIYVEPTGDYTVADYLDGTVDVTKVFLPYVFERWKGLKSFDVCQEPRPAVDDSPSPSPETQVYASRAGSKLVDWKTVDLATMITTAQKEGAEAGTRRPVRFSLFVAKHLQITPAYEQEAGTAVTTAPASPTVRDYG